MKKMNNEVEQVAMDWHSWLSRSNLEPSLVHKYSLTFARNHLQQEDLPYFNHDFLQTMGILVPHHRLEILKLSRNHLNRNLNAPFSKLLLAISNTKKLITRNIAKFNFHNNSSSIQVSDLNIHHNQRGHHHHVPWDLLGTSQQQKVQLASTMRSGPIDSQGGQENVVIASRRNVMRSGPIDRRVQEKLMLKSRSVSLSGPLDGKLHVHAPIGYGNRRSPMVSKPGKKDASLGSVFCRSPTVSGPVDRWAFSPKANYYSNMKMMGADVEEDCEPQSLWSMMFQDIKPT